MRTVFILCLFFFFPAELHAGPEEDELVRREIAIYHAIRRHRSPPGELTAPLEDLHFAKAILTRQPLPANETLSYEGHLRVARELTWAYGYRFSDPPLSRDDYTKYMAARNSRERVFPEETSLYRGMVDQLGERLEIARMAVIVPPVRLAFPPPLAAADFPAVVEGHRPGAKELDISLNQSAGGFNRLADAFQIIATTPTGRELLADFLPMLRQGNIAIEPLTPELALEVSEGRGWVPSALWRYNHVTGKMAIFVNPRAQTGQLVESLVHEIAHATDPRAVGASRELGAKREAARLRLMPFLEAAARRHRIPVDQVMFTQLDGPGREAWYGLHRDLQPASQRRTFLAELHAYGTGDRFRAELVKNFPAAARYYDAHFQRDTGGPSQVSAYFIHSAYGITEFHLGTVPCVVTFLSVAGGP